MRFFGRKSEKEKIRRAREGADRAEQEVKKSKERLEQSQSLIHTLLKIHQENHISPLIHELIEHRVEGQK